MEPKRTSYWNHRTEKVGPLGWGVGWWGWNGGGGGSICIHHLEPKRTSYWNHPTEKVGPPGWGWVGGSGVGGGGGFHLHTPFRTQEDILLESSYREGTRSPRVGGGLVGGGMGVVGVSIYIHHLEPKRTSYWNHRTEKVPPRVGGGLVGGGMGVVGVSIYIHHLEPKRTSYCNHRTEKVGPPG